MKPDDRRLFKGKRVYLDPASSTRSRRPADERAKVRDHGTSTGPH